MLFVIHSQSFEIHFSGDCEKEVMDSTGVEGMNTKQLCSVTN